MRFLQILRSHGGAWNARFFVAGMVLASIPSSPVRADDTTAATPPVAPAASTPASPAPLKKISAPTASPSGATIHFALRFTRTDMTSAADTVKATPVVVGTPALTTLDGNSATMAISGGDLTYSVAVSPTVEKNDKLLILWTLRVGGKSLPGATSALLTGATRVPAGQDAVIAEITLTDPATGRRSDFQLAGVTTVGDAGIGVQ